LTTDIIYDKRRRRLVIWIGIVGHPESGRPNLN